MYIIGNTENKRVILEYKYSDRARFLYYFAWVSKFGKKLY